MSLRNLGDRFEARTELDSLAGPLQDAVKSVLPRGSLKDALHGVWLGHPLHPMLTDLPIGFWTSAWVLDIIGGEEMAPAAQALVGAGVVSALPTAVAGAADWSELNTPERRTGVVHAMANVVATCLYGASYLARRRGHRGAGVALGMGGAAAATVGGYLGGHLSFRRASGANHAAAASAPQDWVAFEGQIPDTEDAARTGNIEDTRVATFTRAGTAHALADRCSHLGGPLHEGDVFDGCVRCPWHASTFRVADGSVVHGPATAPQPAYEIRRDGEGRVEARRKPASL